LTIVALNYGCAAKKKSNRTTDAAIELPAHGALYESIQNQNLTERSFFIERAEFRIRTEDGENAGIATVKFVKPDNFLISIKSFGGIEIARIFLTGDSLFINDRFNRRLYYGSTSYLKDKYGITTILLPVLLGDYINDKKLEKSDIRCDDGKLLILGLINKMVVKYLIECELGKSIMTIPVVGDGESTIEIKYTGFIKSDGINIPEQIEIVEKKSKTTIQIHIKKIVSPWNGKIDFIPGKQYDKIHLQ
jgi:hypothetical protein